MSLYTRCQSKKTCLHTHGVLVFVAFQTFNSVFNKAMECAEWDEDVRTRVCSLSEAITYSVFLYTSQGLFERDKLTFLSHTAFQVRDSGPPQRWGLLSSSSIKILFFPHINFN